MVGALVAVVAVLVVVVMVVVVITTTFIKSRGHKKISKPITECSYIASLQCYNNTLLAVHRLN